MKRKSFLTSLIIVLLAALPSAALAGSAVLHWQSNSDSDLGGYRIYYGTQSRHYGPYIPVDKAVSEYTLNGLVDGRTYYFALTAVDTSGNESGFSAEVSKTIVSGSTDIPIPLPASGAYGNITGGDQSHVNGAMFSFAGSPGNLEVGYEAWDVDNGQEVQIVLNGHVLGYAPVTGNGKWGTTQTLILPDEYVSDSGTNILKFSNTHNPPNKWEWGVRNIQIK